MAQGWRKDYSRYKGFFLNILTVYNSKPTLRAYLELMLSLGTITIFAVFAIKPTILTILDLNNEIKGKENTIQKLDQKINDLKTASSLLQKESSSLIFIKQSVPSGPNVELIISQIEKLAQSNSVNLTSLSASDVFLKGSSASKKKISDLAPLSGGVSELPISFSATGTYQGLYQFLQSIENLRRPIKVDAFIFNSSKTTDNSKIITLTVSGRTPYEK